MLKSQFIIFLICRFVCNVYIMQPHIDDFFDIVAFIKHIERINIH